MVKTQSGSVFSKLKNKHYKMERFCVLFCAFVVVIVLLIISAVRQKSERSKVTLTEQVLYSNNAPFSLTGNYVSFKGAYRNEEGTKVLLFAEVSDNMEGLSTDARDYQMLMTGYNGAKLTGSTPTGAIYMFGELGYMGFYFENPLGFDSQISDIVVRNLRMTKIPEGDVYGGYRDASFAAYNQMQFFVNFAGSEATVVDFLNQDSFTFDEMYATLMNSDTFDSTKKLMDESLIAMNNEYKTINESIAWLNNHNIIVDNIPLCVRGDKIVTDEALTHSNPTYHTVSMDEDSETDVSVDTSYQGWDEVDVNEDALFEYTPIGSEDTAYFVTNYVFSGGVQYNHQNIGLHDKFYNDLIPNTMSLNSWLMELSKTPDYGATSVDLKYYYKDSGFDFNEADSSISVSTMEAIKRYMTRLETSLQKLISTKRIYQTQQLIDLIRTSYDNNASVDLFTVNSEEDTVVVY